MRLGFRHSRSRQRHKLAHTRRWPTGRELPISGRFSKNHLHCCARDRGNAPSGISFAADILRTFPGRDRLSKRSRTTGIGWARAAPIQRRTRVARKTIGGYQSFEIGVNGHLARMHNSNFERSAKNIHDRLPNTGIDIYVTFYL